MKNKGKEFHINKHGIHIVKCCASCVSKKYIQGTLRTCERGIIGRNNLCDWWQMEPMLDNAGSGEGKVKRKEYFEYLKEHRSSSEAFAPVKSIQEGFEEKYGSIYYNF